MLTDSHTHSHLSFDGVSTPRQMCEAAVEGGVSAFVVTDHCDIDGVIEGFYPGYDTEAARREIEEAKAAVSDRVELYRGIELGQPQLYPREAEALLVQGQFDFVIGSVHNLERVPDFFFMDFTDMPEALMEDLYRRMLRDACAVAAFPGVHTLAHISYPLRYMYKAGRQIELARFETDLRRLYHVMQESGTALELNVKGLRQNSVPVSTEAYLFRLWRDCGGTDVTVGSDAHRAEEIGGCIPEGYAYLREWGFTRIMFPGASGITYYNMDITI